MFTAITVCSHDGHVILLDIPGSLEDAQALHINNHACRIKSGSPPSQPYPSTEPKGKRLAQALTAFSSEQLQRQRCLERELVSALNACTTRLGCYNIPWCLPRIIRNATEEHHDPLLATVTEHIDRLLLRVPTVLSPLAGANQFGHMSDIQCGAVLNPSHLQTVLDIGGYQYLIPARSSFVLSSIKDGLCGFRMAAEPFDLILMDPPWTNRSVRRASAYKTHEHQLEDPFHHAVPLLKTHLKPDGIVAVWITNKHAIRAQAVEALGALGLRLQTEWTWLKVTQHGEPVSSIQGVWRKPYEILLIFAHAAVVIPRHTLVAVPDTHSRKPSLKRLFAKYLPSSYTALELFARSLTAGWWSWGDQVLKFQDHLEWEVSDD